MSVQLTLRSKVLETRYKNLDELKTITGTKNIFYANIIDLFDFIQRHNIDTIIRVSIYYYQLASYDVNRIEKGAFPTLKLRKKLLYFESHKI